ncbi:class A beta-lactamase [Hyphomicrobium sp. D-2]|uniref:class A beta-lactamase n=1 Tax=Hyphomicrobium sp. D-2 TaxID=3041621 RepID=UPI002458EF11|nr:class A beta-lactamase [Hyphomicrobium sp. D-2]MDH4981758.1 class A beta-lactamase [Hyphomicrobium sp. D-2]
MSAPITKRAVLSCAVAVLALTGAVANAAEPPKIDVEARLAEIEKNAKGRLGVTIIDTQNGERYGHRWNERFPLCSTFKLLAGAYVLDRGDHDEDNIDRKIKFTAADIVDHSPITKDRVGGDGMTLRELAQAAVTHSDNTAANLVLDNVGGPQGLTAYLRSLGDAATRLDRKEPELNDVPKGDPRDGTLPRVISSTVHRILLGNVLSNASRDQLTEWLKASTTGKERIQAGLREGWTAAGKTGTCAHGSTNELAIIYPPNRDPIIAAVFLTDSDASLEERNKTLAEVGRTISDMY